MVKSHPWQRWPDKNKDAKKKSGYSGQTKDPSWKQSSVQDLKTQAAKEHKDHPWTTKEQAMKIAKDHQRLKQK